MDTTAALTLLECAAGMSQVERERNCSGWVPAATLAGFSSFLGAVFRRCRWPQGLGRQQCHVGDIGALLGSRRPRANPRGEFEGR
jgi:hypothetical protein